MTKSKDDFKILDDISHVLLRPAVYIGSTTVDERQQFYDFKFQSILYNPGLFKIVNEVIDNSIDEHIRTNGKFANKIEITMSDTELSVLDNGRGIPVEKVTDTDGKLVYRPEAAWCKIKAGSNFNDDDERLTPGMNGVGASLANIFSKKFIGETADGKNKFLITCKDNAKIESIKVTKLAKNYTKVTLEPDFARFHVKGFDETIRNMVKDRLNGLAMAFPAITFKFNNETIKAKTSKAFVQAFNPDAIIYSDEGVVLGFMPSEGDFRQYSVINSLSLYNGGTHVDYVLNAIIPTIREGIEKKYKFDVMPAKIKAHLQMVSVIRNFKNMKFDDQKKECLKNKKEEVAVYLEHINYENIAKQILKNQAIIQPIIETQLLKQTLAEEKAEQSKKKELKGKKIAKHIPATSPIIEKKTLFITEGDSALGPFVSVRNSEYQGAIPLRGKVLNTFGKTNSKILANEALADLMVVIGLELGKPARKLNYGTIVIMTDQDVDGGAIRCQLVNFFWNWPELFKEGRVKILNSPRYILRGKKDRHYFYTREEFDDYKGSKTGYELAYIKGLGTLRKEEYKDILANPYYETVVIDNPDYFVMMYGDDASLRKTFMME
jgi:DNA gyrase/topoisomerase IV subunit B